MKYFNIYILFILIILPLFGCQKYNKSNIQLDNKSYIDDFVLFQENPNNQTSVKIISPKAIFDPTNNDIEIFESLVVIRNRNGQDFQVKSGHSTLNNLTNIIRFFNNVKISFLNNENYYIRSKSFDWDLNTSVIEMNNSLNINFDNSKIKATNGFFNIDSTLLKMDNTDFKRTIYNSEGKQEYQLEIKSEFAKWYKNDNTLLFTSNEKQVETTIKFLITE